jgi:hypothetical protein
MLRIEFTSQTLRQLFDLLQLLEHIFAQHALTDARHVGPNRLGTPDALEYRVRYRASYYTVKSDF